MFLLTSSRFWNDSTHALYEFIELGFYFIHFKKIIYSNKFITSFKNIITSLDKVFTSFQQDFKCFYTYFIQIVYHTIPCAYYIIQLGYHFILLSTSYGGDRHYREKERYVMAKPPVCTGMKLNLIHKNLYPKTLLPPSANRSPGWVGCEF